MNLWHLRCRSFEKADKLTAVYRDELERLRTAEWERQQRVEALQDLLTDVESQTQNAQIQVRRLHNLRERLDTLFERTFINAENDFPVEHTLKNGVKELCARLGQLRAAEGTPKREILDMQARLKAVQTRLLNERKRIFRWAVIRNLRSASESLNDLPPPYYSPPEEPSSSASLQRRRSTGSSVMSDDDRPLASLHTVARRSSTGRPSQRRRQLLVDLIPARDPHATRRETSENGNINHDDRRVLLVERIPARTVIRRATEDDDADDDERERLMRYDLRLGTF